MLTSILAPTAGLLPDPAKDADDPGERGPSGPVGVDAAVGRDVRADPSWSISRAAGTTIARTAAAVANAVNTFRRRRRRATCDNNRFSHAVLANAGAPGMHGAVSRAASSR